MDHFYCCFPVGSHAETRVKAVIPAKAARRKCPWGDGFRPKEVQSQWRTSGSAPQGCLGPWLRRPRPAENVPRQGK